VHRDRRRAWDRQDPACHCARLSRSSTHAAADGVVTGYSRRSVTSASRAIAASVGPESLTGREREVTALAMQGMSAKAIGDLLHIGERTVESHLARVYLKFGVHSRQQLVHAIASHAR
jgi:DNA-binding CsgD family transcriptional regulator